MSPTSDATIRTVGCSLQKLVPDAGYLDAIRQAVASTHKATILATELLNLHLRRKLDDDLGADVSCFFDGSWLLNAYNEVTAGSHKVKVIAELRETRERCMPPFAPPDRSGIQQCLLYDARNLATVAATGVWMHFFKHIQSRVRSVFALDEDAYKALSRDQKRHRKLELLQVAADVCRKPAEAHQSPVARHAWVATERARLGIDAAVGEWKGKPLLYHLKAKPHRFLNCMRLMSMEKEAGGGKALALYPLRRNYVPRHVRFDQKALRDLFHVGKSEYIKERAKKKKMQKVQKTAAATRDGEEADLDLPPLRPNGTGYESGDDRLVRMQLGGAGYESGSEEVGPSSAPQSPQPPASNRKRTRRNKDEMADENRELFDGVLDLRAAGVARRQRFDFAFTTDGVCARLQMRSKESSSDNELSSMPKRGIWAIDQLKHVSRLQQLRVVGVDPGKRELVVGVDMDDAKGASPIRYTQKQRLRDLRSRQYADEALRGKHQCVKDAEAELAGFHSRTADLDAFRAYCVKRHESLEECLAFYADLGHRKRRWKTAIKAQQSEERLYERLRGIKKKGDTRPIVLAYGSWGMIAGRAGAACNRGNTPCIGVGLMRKLSKRFVVSPTPEAYTSKTCCRCLGSCEPWEEKEAAMGYKIRGLRRCTQRDCRIPLNRDKNGAINIGTNFKRLFEGRVPIRSMSDEDLAFHRASLCLECE